jgi:hypothetical protein
VIMGSWNRPDDARGPKVIRAIRQPHTMMSSGEKRDRAEEADMLTALKGKQGCADYPNSRIGNIESLSPLV